MWVFQEPTLTVNGTNCNDSEHYYHSQKPVPWDMATWEAMKVDVMTKAVWEKVLRSEDVRLLLLSTREHPLVSIKTDYFWGFHPSNKEVSVNALAVILMSIRTALRRVCGEVSGRVRQKIYRLPVGHSDIHRGPPSCGGGPQRATEGAHAFPPA